MGVAVLNPQSCLKDPSFSHQPLISPPKSKPSSRNLNRAARAQPNRRKRSPQLSTSQLPPARSTQPKSLVDGQVRILKRGENIASSSENRQDPDLGTNGLLGPAPESVPTRMKLAEPNNKISLFYAGSAFFTSPPPSSVPLPAFFTRKSAVPSSDDATSGLRRLLRLDLQ